MYVCSIINTQKIKEFDENIDIIITKQKTDSNFISKSSSTTIEGNVEISDLIKQKQDISISKDQYDEYLKKNKIQIDDICIKLFPNLNSGFQVVTEKTVNTEIENDKNIEKPNEDSNNSKLEIVKEEAKEVENGEFSEVYYSATDIRNKSTSFENSTIDINASAFNSAMNFYESISSICEKVRLFTDVPTSLKFLKRELIDINTYLPANVYIPFAKLRNYIIAHISIPETRIFKTKNRAPYMLVLELIRVEEINAKNESQNTPFEKKNKSFDKKKKDRQTRKTVANKKSFGFVMDKLRSSFYSSSSANSDDSISEYGYSDSPKSNSGKKANKSQPKIKSKISIPLFINNKIYENDIQNSKAITVSKFDKDDNIRKM